MTRLRHPLMLFTMAALAAFAAYFVPFALVTRPDVAYMDTLSLILLQDEVRQGLPFAQTWDRMGSAHRGWIAPAYGYLNAELFAFDFMGAILTGGLVLAATAVLLVRSMRGPGDPLFVSRRLGMLATASLWSVVLVGAFSLASFEVFTLDYGLVLFTKNLVLVAFLAWWARLMNAPPFRPVAVASAGAAGVAIVLAIAMGWSYAFVAACAVVAADAWWTGGRRKTTAAAGAAVVAALLIGLWAYTTRGSGVDALGGFNGHESQQPFHAAKVVLAVLLGFSSIMVGNETADQLHLPIAVQAAAGALLLSATCAAAIGRARRLGPASALPYGLMAYAAACIVAIAVARGRIDPTFARASRYFIDYALLMVGLCWAAWYGPRAAGGAARRWQLGIAGLAWACFGLFLLGQATTNLIEWRKATSRAHYFTAMRMATSCGVRDEADASLLQAPSRELAAKAVALQSDRRIGAFRDGATPLPACLSNLRSHARAGYGAAPAPQ